jgi:hypothetical protein
MMADLLKFASQFKDEIAGITAICALVVSFVSVFFTVLTLWVQRRHNILSVRPLAQIALGDYEDELFVRLRNQGVGPLLVQSIDIYDRNGKFVGHDLVRQLPLPPERLAWADYTMFFPGMAVPAGSNMVLFQFKGSATNPEFVAHRDEIRAALSALRLEIVYRDVYGKRLPRIGGPATWFGNRILRAKA